MCATSGIKLIIKNQAKALRLAFSRKYLSFGPKDLSRTLITLNVREGDAVMVHSSWDHLSAFSGKPSDVIEVLETAVGSSGTILMPTLPFTGTAIQYVSSGTIFDARRTPSRMGLLTELFRRNPGTLRSVHPTHSVAARGAEARFFVETHHLSQTPCDRYSPFGKLLKCPSRIVFLGTNIDVMTFFHTVESILEPRMPFSPFTSETYTLRSINSEGQSVTTTARLFDPDCSRRRNLTPLVRELKRMHALRRSRLGALLVTAVRPQEVLEAAQNLADRRIFCYD
jgi:aminoglycoside 3-N-acetyltransferase